MAGRSSWSSRPARSPRCAWHSANFWGSFSCYFDHSLVVAHCPCARLPYRPHGSRQHGYRRQHGKPGRHSGHFLSGHREYFRGSAGLVDPECFYLGESPVAGGADSACLCDGPEPDCVAGELWRWPEPVLEECRLAFAAPGADRHRRPHGDGEPAGAAGGGAGGLAVLVRCLEQHHVHGRRGQESQTKHSAVRWFWARDSC